MSGRLVTCVCGLRVMRAGYSKHERACRGVKPAPAAVHPPAPPELVLATGEWPFPPVRVRLHAIGATP